MTCNIVLPFVTVCRTETDVSLCTSGWPWQTASGSSKCLSLRNSKLTTSRVLFLEQLRCQTSGDRDIVQILKKIHCLHRIRASQNVVSQRCACRCGPRIAFVASGCRTKKLPCSTHAAAGCVLLSSHTPPPGLRCRVTQTDVTLQSYNYQDGFLQQQDAGHPSAGETRRAVGPNHARWLSSITNSCRKCATFSTWIGNGVQAPRPMPDGT